MAESEWTCKRLLEWTTDHFTKAEVDQPRLSAEVLLGQVLKKERIQLYVGFDYCPTKDELGIYRDLVKRCADHEPLAYLTEKGHFFNLELKVNSSVLIPRPETEMLVDEAIAYLTEHGGGRVLDLCCGSGCVGIAIAKNFEGATVVATDVSDEALSVASENAALCGVDEQMEFKAGDLFGALEDGDVFDVIVSNPPYVSDEEYAKVEKNVKDYEPAGALRGGVDGLDYYRRIAVDAELYLAKGGALIVEIGYEQREAVIRLFSECGYLCEVEGLVDGYGQDRVVRARKVKN